MTHDNTRQMREALTAIRSIISGYAGQPSLLGDLFKIADAALASGTLTEGGDVEQAPSDGLSGPTGNAGDAQ